MCRRWADDARLALQRTASFDGLEQAGKAGDRDACRDRLGPPSPKSRTDVTAALRYRHMVERNLNGSATGGAETAGARHGQGTSTMRRRSGTRVSSKPTSGALTGHFGPTRWQLCVLGLSGWALLNTRISAATTDPMLTTPPAIASVGTQEPMVRRLFRGGRWIRTIGTA